MERKSKTGKIFDYIESELPCYSPEDRKLLARDIIKWAAIHSVDDDNENLFAPIETLDGIREELTEEIDREVLDIIGKEVVAVAKEQNKK